MLYLIYTSDTNNQIGTECLFEKTCKEDKDYFKTLTLKYHNVVMGRKTFESLAKPLKNRNNIVLTRSNISPTFPEGYFTNKVEVDTKKDYIIAGGKEIYEMFWDKVDVVYHTIHKNVDFGGIKFEPDFAKFVLFEKSESEDLIKEIWVRQSYKDLEISFENHPNFEFIKSQINQEKTKYKLELPVTGSMLVKDQNRLTKTQDLSKHKLENVGDNICVREKLRKAGLVKSGEYYDQNNQVICDGCFGTNHSEYVAVEFAKEQNLDFANGTCYLAGHYWSCQSCQKSLKSIGVRNIILDKDFVTKFLGILSLG